MIHKSAEQTVAHGAAGRAVLKWKVIRRGPVNGGVRAHMAKDALSAAVSKILWPFLKEIGFSKSTNRKFAREKNGVIQQVWVDANGVSKSESTRIVLCCTFPYAESHGYMDPHGFIINNGKHYDMSTESAAQHAMQQVVAALEQSQLAALDKISDIESMLAALKPLTGRQSPARTWFSLFSELQERWTRGDSELQRIAVENRRRLRL